MQVTKRDGRKVEFDRELIELAVEKAAIADGWGEIEARNMGRRIGHSVETGIANEGKYLIDIEHIQDVVEETLMVRYPSVAKAYILYREKRTKMRRINSEASVALINEYVGAADWRVKENSNMGFSLQGLNNYISSDISAEYWLNSIYTEEIRKAHISGDLHIHDLGLLAPYCNGWDLMDLLKTGFRGVAGKTSFRPPNNLQAALGQIVSFLFTLQGEAAGAQAFSSFDTLLAPFVRKDNLSYEQVKQLVQSFVCQMNVATRVGGQPAFTNITLDMLVPSTYLDTPVVIGGKEQDTTYGEYQAEMDMLNRAFAEIMCEGDADGRIFTFPIPTYNITKDFDWESPRFNPVWVMSGKLGVPYFANFVNSDMSPDDARSMCCRLRLDNRELRKRGGGLFGANPLTGSMGVVTLNLPRLAYDAKTEPTFFDRLERLMALAKDSLCLKRRHVEEFTECGLYPYSRFYLREVKNRFDKYWANHFSTIGLVGMNEACLNLFGEGIASQRGKEFAERVLTFMRDKMASYQEETGDNFNLEASPAEGTSFRLALLDRRSGRDMVFANGKSEPGKIVYYTNSSQLPVGHTEDLFAALDHQDSLQSLYTGGTVLHGFLGEEVKDPETVKRLVKTITDNYSLPYFTLTPTFSVCSDHGYLSGEVSECPTCGNDTEVYSRVVGYYRPVSSWNEGKAQEFLDRKEFVVPEA